MKDSFKPTIERLRYLLHYDPDTGVIKWINNHRKDFIGKEAGNIRDDGKRRIKIDGKLYYAHVVAWAIYHGYWPTLTIDHRNRDGLDNKLKNLREATYTQQSQNRSFHNSTGHRGIRKQGKKFSAQIQMQGCKKHLGTYASLDEAVAARKAAERELFGEFAP